MPFQSRYFLRILVFALILLSSSCTDLFAGIGLGGRYFPVEPFRLLRPNHGSWRWRLGGEDSIRFTPNNNDGTAILPGSFRGLTFSRSRSQNAWLLVSTCLVFCLVVPGLALFYGALHQIAGIARLVGQSFGTAAVVSVLWWLFGYSLVFGDGGNAVFGDFTKFAFLRGLGSTMTITHSALDGGSKVLFCVYQLMFAIVTAVLIVTTTAGRVRFPLVLMFITVWMILVYFPLAHMIMSGDGLMNGLWNPKAKIRAIDYGAGAILQIAAGWSALILFLTLGRRSDPPISGATIPAGVTSRRMILFFVGEAMLWIGWYGFNSGWAASTQAVAQAFTSTTIATLAAAFAWVTADQTSSGSAGNLAAFSGIVAGLAAITPGAGFVSPTGALVIGLCAGLIQFPTRLLFRFWRRYDAAVETFGVHALGGTIGLLMTGILTSNSNLNPGLTIGSEAAQLNGLARLLANGGLWIEQLKAVLITVSLSGLLTLLLASFLKALQEPAGFKSLLHRSAHSTSS